MTVSGNVGTAYDSKALELFQNRLTKALDFAVRCGSSATHKLEALHDSVCELCARLSLNTQIRKNASLTCGRSVVLDQVPGYSLTVMQGTDLSGRSPRSHAIVGP